MLAMHDLLLLMRPKNIHIWGEMNDIDVTGFIEEACRRVRSILVGDVMTTDVITITPDTHILMIVDIMIKKHVRRLPVVEGSKVIGIVYTSTIFYELMETLVSEGRARPEKCMPIIDRKNALSGLTVREAMRRLICYLRQKCHHSDRPSGKPSSTSSMRC